MEPMFWAWVVIAVVLLVLEGTTGDLLVLPWGIGAGVAAGLNALGAGAGWQWIAFAVLSSALVVVLQRRARRE